MYSLHIFKSAGIVIILFASLTTAFNFQNRDEHGPNPEPQDKSATAAATTEVEGVTGEDANLPFCDELEGTTVGGGGETTTEASTGAGAKEEDKGKNGGKGKGQEGKSKWKVFKDIIKSGWKSLKGLFAKLRSGMGEKTAVPCLKRTKQVCNAIPNPKSTHYIVGYGSLMQNASKSRTYPDTGESIPVTLSGFTRNWNVQNRNFSSLSTTFLGVNKATSSDSFNAVVFKLPPGDPKTILESFDRREGSYCRQLVQANEVKYFDTKLGCKENCEYWIYINKPDYTYEPDKEHPIVQSYADIFLSGCLEIEEKYGLIGFAEKCVETTIGWSNKYWVNDRIYPRRPSSFEPRYFRIDRVLAAKVPKAFKAIVIEG